MVKNLNLCSENPAFYQCTNYLMCNRLVNIPLNFVLIALFYMNLTTTLPNN